MKIFRPMIYKKSIYDINYNELLRNNIHFLIIDLDNTIGLINEVQCSNKMRDFLNKLSDNFTIFVFSNNNKKRVITFCSKLKVIPVYNACKPLKKGYRYIQKKYNINANNLAVIGDQIVTDILLGNRLCALTILVDPLGDKDLKITKLNRFIEKIIRKKIDLKRGNYYEKD